MSVSLSDLKTLGITSEEIAFKAIDPMFRAINAYINGDPVEPYLERITDLGVPQNVVIEAWMHYREKYKPHISS